MHLLHSFRRIGIWRAYLAQVGLIIPGFFLILTAAAGGTVELLERWSACTIVGDVCATVCFLVGVGLYRLERIHTRKARRSHTAGWHFLISTCVAPLGLWLGYQVLWITAGPLHLGTPRATTLADMRLAFFLAGCLAVLIYLLRSRFEVAIELADTKALLKRLEEARTAEPKPLTIRQGAKVVLVKPEDISAVIARGRYAGLVVNGSELLADQTLEELTKTLNPDIFFRTHRGAIINLKFLKELRREGDRRYFAVLADSRQTSVPISRDRLTELKRCLVPFPGHGAASPDTSRRKL